MCLRISAAPALPHDPLFVPGKVEVREVNPATVVALVAQPTILPLHPFRGCGRRGQIPRHTLYTMFRWSHVDEVIGVPVEAPRNRTIWRECESSHQAGDYYPKLQLPLEVLTVIQKLRNSAVAGYGAAATLKLR